MELHAEFEEPVWRKKVSMELTKISSSFASTLDFDLD